METPTLNTAAPLFELKRIRVKWLLREFDCGVEDNGTGFVFYYSRCVCAKREAPPASQTKSSQLQKSYFKVKGVVQHLFTLLLRFDATLNMKLSLA